MPHLDPDRLVLIALDEQAPSPAESEHLDTCALCAGDLSESRAVALIGRDSHRVRDLPPPPEDLWNRIAGQVFPAPAREPETPVARPARRWQLALVAVAAALLGIAVVVGVQQIGGHDAGRVVARANLLPQPSAPPGAHGTAQIIDTGHGLQMRVVLSGMPDPNGYYAVWLYDGSSVMIPVGSPGSAPLNLPAAAGDLGRFPIVDVSAQRLGQQEHGVSMLQGRLSG